MRDFKRFQDLQICRYAWSSLASFLLKSNDFDQHHEYVHTLITLSRISWAIIFLYSYNHVSSQVYPIRINTRMSMEASGSGT